MPGVPVQVSSLGAALELTKMSSIIRTMLGSERQMDNDRKVEAQKPCECASPNNICQYPSNQPGRTASRS